MSKWTSFSLCAAGHILASGLFIGGIQLYNHWHPGQEAWSVLLPLLGIAWVGEWFVIVAACGALKINVFRGRVAASVLGSWILGVICFLFLDTFARSWIGHSAPAVAWVFSVGLLMKLLSVCQSENISLQ